MSESNRQVSAQEVWSTQPRPDLSENSRRTTYGRQELQPLSERFEQERYGEAPFEESSPLDAYQDDPYETWNPYQHESLIPERQPTFANWTQNNNDIPAIPEPMVFDLVRPLGARKGELEVNVLGLVPLRRSLPPNGGEIPDPLGLVPRSADRQGIEWAPEIELALWDGFAIEFEVPMEDTTLEAYKFAVQQTFGTAFQNQFIHGFQGIIEYVRHPQIWEPTLLYLAAWRFDDTWSVMSMFGMRTEISNKIESEQTQILANFTLFANLSDDLIFGWEVNHARAMNGVGALLIMPQLHYQFNDKWTLQFGAGSSFTKDYTLPQAAFRLIREF